jgi:hypothetical protein
MAESLPRKFNALGSNSVLKKEKKKREEKQCSLEGHEN